MAPTRRRAPRPRRLAEAGALMAHGTTDEKLAWASAGWQATVAEARRTNAARREAEAAAPAPWTPRYGHRH